MIPSLLQYYESTVITGKVPRWNEAKPPKPWRFLALVVIASLLVSSLTFTPVFAQLQQSGGTNPSVSTTGTAPPGSATLMGGSVTTAAPSYTTGQMSALSLNLAGGLRVDGSGVTQPVSGTLSINALPNGTNNVGLVRIIPSACTQSTNFANSTVGVATGAGTTVTSTTTCVTYAYANNITNSAVTLRLADRQGTPVIWLGGAADFSIPANSNMRIPVDGVTFTTGITAIAGTASAINLQINGLQ